MFERLRRLNSRISSRRFRNSGRKARRTSSITCSRTVSADWAAASAARCALPRLEVSTISVFLKSTVRPWPSVSRPSSSTCNSDRSPAPAARFSRAYWAPPSSSVACGSSSRPRGSVIRHAFRRRRATVLRKPDVLCSSGHIFPSRASTDGPNPTFGLRVHAVCGPSHWCSMDLPLVLVVEDEFLVRMNAVCLLEEAGFAVLEAGSADEAIALLESRRDIRIFFTDINMPGSMDGLRLAHAIRNRWPPIELVLTSGQMRVRNEDMPERGLFLGKPYEQSELVQVVRSLVSYDDTGALS